MRTYERASYSLLNKCSHSYELPRVSVELKSASLASVLCARGKIRTYDRSSISRVLYQLSYSRICYIFNLLTVCTFEQSTSLRPSLASSGHLHGRATRAIRAYILHKHVDRILPQNDKKRKTERVLGLVTSPVFTDEVISSSIVQRHTQGLQRAGGTRSSRPNPLVSFR